VNINRETPEIDVRKYAWGGLMGRWALGGGAKM